MNILYDASVNIVAGAYRLLSLFNSKARLSVEGRRGLLDRLEAAIDPTATNVWFHAASLGEFEQGRPVIEAYRRQFPDHKIVLTFFSPSGYEVRKNYAGADHIFYLPIDTAKNARRFLEIVKPKKAIFIKYEFWHNYLRLMAKSGIQCCSISAIFLPEYHYFRWYGSMARNDLRTIDMFFVQNEQSVKLLEGIGIRRAVVAGDTRFDRVYEIAQSAKNLPKIEQFAEGASVLVAGSTWPKDNEILVEIINSRPDMKFIIAPHEIHNDQIERLMAAIKRPSIRYTKLTENDDTSEYDVMIIDTIGILSSVYQYGKLAYIGGGFGVGIHNILEAATFGLPLAFGPNYQKFAEAKDLIAKSGAISIKNADSLARAIAEIEENYDAKSAICRDYVKEKRGATQQIIAYLTQNS